MHPHKSLSLEYMKWLLAVLPLIQYTGNLKVTSRVSQWLSVTHRMKPQGLILLFTALLYPAFLSFQPYVSQLLKETLQARQTSVFKIPSSYLTEYVTFNSALRGLYASCLNFVQAKKPSSGLQNSRNFPWLLKGTLFSPHLVLLAFADIAYIFGWSGQNLDSFPFTSSIQVFR